MIDFSKFAFNFTNSPESNESVLFLALPFIKTWAYHFHYNFNIFGIKNNGFLRVSVDNATAVVALTLKAAQSG